MTMAKAKPTTGDDGVTALEVTAFPTVEWTHPRTGEVRKVRYLGVQASGASVLVIGADESGAIRTYLADQCRLS